MTTLITAVLLAILIHIMRRLLLRLLGWAAVALAIYAVWRIAPDLGLARAWLHTFAGAAVVGFGVGVLFALRPIVNFLIEGDYSRAVERARQDADRRRV